MNQEDKLLLACTRTQLNADHIAQINTLAQADLDWPNLVKKACQHRVMPLLYYHLNQVCPQTVPGPILARLRDLFYASYLRNNFLAQELVSLLDDFAANDIRVLTFKGAAFASAVYGDLSLRQFGDLDLLIDEQDVERAKALMDRRDYKSTLPLPWEINFERRDGQVGVDLHWAFGRLRRTFPLFLDDVWHRRVLVSLNGGDVPGLSPEDRLLVRCQGAAQDYWKADWPRLQHICDVAELIRAYPQLDWSRVMEQAGRLRCRGILYLFLSLAADLLEADVPETVRQAIKADPQIGPLVQAARQRLVPDTTPQAAMADQTFLARNLFCLRLKEHLPLSPALSFKLLYGLSWLYYVPRTALSNGG